MQLTENERAALVEELAEAMYGSVTFDGGYTVSRSELVRGAAQCLPIIDRLLTDRAVPEPDADAVEAAAKAIYDLAPAGDYLVTDPRPMGWEPYSWDDIVEETREEIRVQARAALAAVPTVQAAVGDDLDAERILRLIDEAVAARDAEIREALLSERTAQRVEATVSYMDGYRDHDIADGVIGTALAAIGLHGDTGGRGYERFNPGRAGAQRRLNPGETQARNEEADDPKRTGSGCI